MTMNPIVFLGPSGIGKTALDQLLRNTVVRIDPLRLREEGPRNSADELYAPPRLRTDLEAIYRSLGFSPILVAPEVCWFAEPRTLFAKVRDDWQVLFLGDLRGDLAKAEIYGPLMELMLSEPTIATVLGNVDIVVLNPASKSLAECGADFTPIKTETAANLKARGGDPKTIATRVSSVDVEAPSWLSLVEAFGGLEVTGWPFAEYCYDVPCPREVLVRARRRLVQEKPSLARYFRSEAAIE